MAYEEIGIKKYQFVAALSELTCDRCGSLDGSVFDTDKAVEGENFPPIHPRCRCVTIMADVNLTSRIARDPLTGENYKVNGSMTFDEWKNSLSDEQKNALKYVANAEKRGIIKENTSDKPITKITDKIINKVPKVEVPNFTEEQNVYLQQQHKELLRYARDNNDNKEVAFVFESDLTNRSELLGTDERLDLGMAVIGKGQNVVVLHNHPRNSSYSNLDIDFFIGSDSVSTMTIVKNNGGVETITKGEKYEKDTFIKEWNRLIAKSKGNINYSKMIKTILNKTKSGVIWSERT